MSFLGIIKIIAIPIALLISGVVYKKFPKVKQDNFVEEFVEDVLEAHVGVNIDLSPETEE